MVTGQNAPQGVEKVHCECRIHTESNDRGNNTGVKCSDWKSAI